MDVRRFVSSILVSVIRVVFFLLQMVNKNLVRYLTIFTFFIAPLNLWTETG